jgi:outer membrane immunogenic protein
MTFKFIKAGVSALALLAIPFAAQAADMPIKPPYYKGQQSVVAYYNWTGFYAGINGGYSWGDAKFTSSAGTSSTAPRGFLAGGTVGYNYQSGAWVFGLEGDLDWADLNHTNASVACGTSCVIKDTWLGTARGRVGYAFDRWLPYLTGGAAFGNVYVGNSVGAVSSTKTGWTAGVGLEYAFLGNWTTKIEYLHVDLGSANCSAACAPPLSAKFTAEVVRLGLNYKFAGPIFSRY